MPKNPFPLALAIIATGTLVMAHGGVTNSAVMARMNAMTAQRDATKVLGQMAKGETVFDRQTVREAFSEIARQAAETPELFKARETDPKSEARPVIWDTFGDFSAKADALETVATTLAGSVETQADLRAGLGQIGAACTACHQVYRE